jgi:acyl-CoA thioester hydrolase
VRTGLRMLILEIVPRSSETNATGHIDHAVLPVWLELAREPVYRLFNPDLSFSGWNTVIRRIEIDFLDQVRYHKQTEIRTGVSEVRNTSFTVTQELWQEGTLAARAATVIVHFDYRSQSKLPISAAVRKRLLELHRD